jgi:hypothetical protein
MIIDFEIQFTKQPPSFIEIVKKLEEHTGLDNFDTRGNGISHNEFGDQWFIFEFHEKKIILFCIRPYVWYLLEAALAVLEEMGGRVENWDVRAEAKKPWSVVKNTYVNHSLL